MIFVFSSFSAVLFDAQGITLIIRRSKALTFFCYMCFFFYVRIGTFYALQICRLCSVRLGYHLGNNNNNNDNFLIRCTLSNLT